MIVRKYKINPDDPMIILPKASTILEVRFQGTDLMVWVLVKEGGPPLVAKFHVVKTDEELPDVELGYIGSATMMQAIQVPGRQGVAELTVHVFMEMNK